MNQPMTTEKAAMELRELAIEELDLSEDEIDRRASELYDSYKVIFKSNAYHRVLAQEREDVERTHPEEDKVADQLRFKVGPNRRQWSSVDRRLGFRLHQLDADVDADGHVYVLELDHDEYDEPWFYVGMVKGDLFSRLGSHLSGFRQSVEKGGQMVSMAPDTVSVEDVERIINVQYEQTAELRNVERKTSYQVALDYETTHVVGGM